ncbi:hypothetical protein D9M70_537820 [compost metagenome]
MAANKRIVGAIGLHCVFGIRKNKFDACARMFSFRRFQHGLGEIDRRNSVAERKQHPCYLAGTTGKLQHLLALWTKHTPHHCAPRDELRSGRDPMAEGQVEGLRPSGPVIANIFF